MPNNRAHRTTLSRSAGEGGSPVRASRVRVIAPSPQPSPPVGEREDFGAPGEGNRELGSTDKKRVCVGIVAGAHGVRGAVRIKTFTAQPKGIVQYGPVEDETGQRKFELRFVGTAKGVVLAKPTGIEDRDRAEAMRGMRLYLPREALPPPDEEEYYHADLIGLAAVLEDGTAVGTVQAVHDFGAGDCLEIARPAGPPLIAPFTRGVVPVVDLAGGRIVLHPPPGLLDAPKAAKRREAQPA